MDRNILLFLSFGLFCYFIGFFFNQYRLTSLNKFFQQIRQIVLKWGDVIFILFAVLFLILSILYFWPISRPDAIQLVIFQATFFTLFYSVIIGNKPNLYRNRPISHIEFNFEEPDCHLTTAVTVIANTAIDTYYVRFRFKNIGKGTIKNAQVILEKVKQKDKYVSSFLPINLIWALTENQSNRGLVDVPQGVFRTVDCFKVMNPSQTINAAIDFSHISSINPIYSSKYNKLAKGISICGITEPNTLSDILPFGNYFFYFTICSDNTAPLFAKFKVDYRGNWTNVLKTMFSPRHLNVKLISFSEDKNEIFN